MTASWYLGTSDVSGVEYLDVSNDIIMHDNLPPKTTVVIRLHLPNTIELPLQIKLDYLNEDHGPPDTEQNDIITVDA